MTGSALSTALCFLLFPLTSVTSVTSVTTREDTCFARKERPWLLVGTKTGYSVVENTESSPLTSHPLHPQHCGEYEFSWLLARHGTRFPSGLAIRQMERQLPKIREQIVNNHRGGRGSLCTEDLDNLDSWDFYLTSQDESLLTESGRREMLGLGQRWRNRTPAVRLPEENIGFTDTQRTRESARNFARGFLNKTEINLPPPVENQELLNYWVVCEKFKKNIQKKINTPVSPDRRFIKRHTLPAIRDLVVNINKKLGYRNLTLTFKAVELMWDMCSEDSGSADWPWCAVFSSREMALLEQNEDLHYYYQDGYHYNISRQMTGVLLGDLLESLTRFQRGEAGAAVNRAYFAHSETFLPFLARLGLARDEPPLSPANIPEDRQWRTSLIGPESSNLMVVGARCRDQAVALKFFLNERLLEHVRLPGFAPDCQEENFCQLESFVRHYQQFALTNISQACQL